MKNSILILGFILILFGGCDFKQNRIDIHHYAIDFKSNTISSQVKLGAIFIEEPNVNKSFNLSGIFYNSKPYLFEEYAQNRWINLPSNMLHNQIIDSFNTSGIFSNVISKDKTLKHEYSLKTELTKLYHTFEGDKSYAIVKINFNLIKDKKIVKSIKFDKKILCETNDAYGFVQAANNGLKESIEISLKEISSM